MENPRRWYVNPILKDSRPAVLVRLSVISVFVLSSIEGRYPLLPSVFSPVMKM